MNREGFLSSREINGVLQAIEEGNFSLMNPNVTIVEPYDQVIANAQPANM